jgi:hypothetical protein
MFGCFSDIVTLRATAGHRLCFSPAAWAWFFSGSATACSVLRRGYCLSALRYE